MTSHEQAPPTTGDDTNDNAATIILREEHLHAGTEIREAAKVRFRKVIVTEEKTITVIVRHEELRVDQLIITDGKVVSSSEIPADREQAIILREEVPVVTMTTRAVEAVNITVDRVTSQQTLTDQVRKERIEVADDPGTTGDDNGRA